MSTEQDKEEKAKPAAETAPPQATPAAAAPTAGENLPPSREEALNRLRAEAADLSSIRSSEIVAETLDQLGGGATVNVFQGEFTVEGDFHTGPGAGPSRRRVGKTRLDPTALADADWVFVPPPDFDLVVDTLLDKRLAIIADPAGTGRRARGVAALLAVLRRWNLPVEVLELGGNVLGNRGWRVPQRRCAMIVVDRPAARGGSAAEAIDDEWLAHAEKVLRENESLLVVVTTPVRGELAKAPRRSEFVLSDLEPADQVAIVRRRVLDENPLEPAELDDLLAGTDLVEVLRERDNPAFAVRTAKAITEALRTGGDLADTLARLNNPEDQVREWLVNDPDAAEVAFVLATAVLEGSSYLKVTDAAVALYKELGSGSAGLTLRYMRGLLAERSWIVNGRSTSDPDGPMVLRFRNARLRHAVLVLTWFELDGVRPKVLAWLSALAEHPDVELRARAASTAGILATSDFEHGLHQYFVPWGGSDSTQLRQSAASGLNIAGRASEHTETVWEHVEQWAELVRHDDTATALPATAALTAGGPIGVADPRRALRVLRAVVCEGNWSLLEPAALSTLTLLEAGRVPEVLDALLEWSGPTGEDEPVTKALIMFAFAARESGGGDRPVLLPHAMAHQEALPELWGRALRRAPVRGLALEGLRAWVSAADADPSVYEPVLYLVAGIADLGEHDFGRVETPCSSGPRTPTTPPRPPRKSAGNSSKQESTSEPDL